MFKRRRLRAAVLAISTALAVPAVGLVTSSAAQAGNEPRAGNAYVGKVIATSLNIRSYPTTASKRLGTLTRGTKVKLSCKVKAVPVDGNRLWYVLDDERFVAARYVENVTSPPSWCGGRWWDRGSTIKKPSVTLHRSPTPTSVVTGKLRYASTVGIICKVNGPDVGGNPRWYQLEDGRWVAARYVRNLVDIPGYCTT